MPVIVLLSEIQWRLGLEIFRRLVASDTKFGIRFSFAGEKNEIPNLVLMPVLWITVRLFLRVN